MPRIGNRSYPPPVLSDQQRGVVSGLLADMDRVMGPQTQIGNRTYAGETTGQAAPQQQPPSKIMDDLHGYAMSLGKTPNDLTLPELNQFIGQYGGPVPNTMYKLPRNY